MQKYKPGIFLFLLFLTIGLYCFRDYGISFDEPEQRKIGYLNYNYIVWNNDSLLAYMNKVYPVGYELPLVVAEKALHLTDSRDIYLARHLITHLAFLLSAFLLYVLVCELYSSQLLACAAFLMLVSYPRMYPHSFINSKDIPFVCVTIWMLAGSYFAFLKKKPGWFLLLGLICGYGFSIRIMSLLITAILGSFMGIDLISNLRNKKGLLNSAKSIILFGIGFCFLAYAGWPFLWRAPITNFQYAYDTFSKFQFLNTFYQGRTLRLDEMPWHYGPFWILTTVPVVYLAAGLIATLLILFSFIKKPLQYVTNTAERNTLLHLLCFALPVFLMAAFHYTLYDDWRHLFFVYPALVMLVVFAMHRLSKGGFKTISRIILSAQLLLLGLFMVRNHPFEQVYFNELVSHKDEYFRKHYEFDYWGSSVKQAYDYILSHDDRPLIKVCYSHEPLYNNYLMLPAEQRKRIQLMENSDDFDYYITNFRNHPDEFNYPQVVYAPKVLNNTIVKVYKVR